MNGLRSGSLEPEYGETIHARYSVQVAYFMQIWVAPRLFVPIYSDGRLRFFIFFGGVYTWQRFFQESNRPAS